MNKDLIVRDARIYDCNSPLDGGRHTLWLRGGCLHAVDPSELPAGAQELRGEGLAVSPSWCDLRAHLCDPGEEHKEDLLTGLSAAAAGGFSALAPLPDTSPVLQNRSQLQYILTKARPTGMQLHPLAALSVNQGGERLSELLDLLHAGAAAVSDGLCPLNNTGLLVQALRYLRPFGGLIMHRAEEHSLMAGAVMHEGITSTTMGLVGAPTAAETLGLQASLGALNYVGGGRLHINCLSSAEGIKLVKQARKRSEAAQQLTADVAIHQLLFTDKQAQDFDTNYRADPPYRLTSDRAALIQALKKGHIQAIVSNHRPQAPEDKLQPFARAAPGCITLQTMLAALLSIRHELPLGQGLRALYDGPRRILQQAVPRIAPQEPLSITIFDTEAHWRFDASSNKSKSSNSPFYGQTLLGEVLAVVVGRHYLFSPPKEKRLLSSTAC